MDVWTLSRKYYENNPGGHFFDRDTLKFFGERMSEMYVFKNKEKVKDGQGVEHECYVLSSLQRVPYVGKRRHYAWFDANTFEEILQ